MLHADDTLPIIWRTHTHNAFTVLHTIERHSLCFGISLSYETCVNERQTRGSRRSTLCRDGPCCEEEVSDVIGDPSDKSTLTTQLKVSVSPPAKAFLEQSQHRLNGRSRLFTYSPTCFMAESCKLHRRKCGGLTHVKANHGDFGKTTLVH